MLRFSVAFFRSGIKEQKTASGTNHTEAQKSKMNAPCGCVSTKQFCEKEPKRTSSRSHIEDGMPFGKGGEGGSGQEIFERFFEKAAQAIVCQTGIIRTGLGAILFGAFAQPKLDNMYTIACVPPEQNHPKISCSEVRAVPRPPIFG